MSRRLDESASDQAYRWTREQILAGAFAPGEMISEGEVSERVGLSRTPVREAFLRLSAEGMLRLFPKRGALVTPITESDVREVLEARLLIEPWAAQTVALQSDRSSLVETLRMHAAGLAAGSSRDPAAFQEADRAFHEAILAAAGNKLLADFYATLRDRQLRLGAAAVASRHERVDSIVDEHRQIAETIAAGDADGAARVVRAHIETTRRLLLPSDRGFD